jgi:hypothetical protein
MESDHIKFKRTVLQIIVKVICIAMIEKMKLNYNDFEILYKLYLMKIYIN